MTMLSRPVTEEMALDLTRLVRQERIASVHQVVQAPVILLSSFQVGSRRVTDLEVLVMSLPSALRVDGLLGVNFLERFCPTFEFDETTLVLR